MKLRHPTDPIRKGELMLGWCLTLIAQLLTELNHSLLKKRLICPRSGEITFFRVILFINRGPSHTIGSCFLECRRSSTGWPLIQSSNQKPNLATRKPKEHTKQTKGLAKQQRSCLCRRNRVSTVISCSLMKQHSVPPFLSLWRNGVRADFLSISDDSRNLSANSLPVIECSDVTDLVLT